MSELQQFCVKCGGAISFDISQAGTSIFCLHCGQQVQLKSDSATHPEPSQSSPPPPAINDTPEEIFLLIDNQQHGPYSEANLSEYLKAGQVTPETLVWWEGKEGWEPLSQQTELNLGFNSSSRGSDLAPTDIAPECPDGHGQTREWEGQWRCSALWGEKGFFYGGGEDLFDVAG